MHTSGTTAAPKQVVLTRGNWLANALGSAVALGLDPAERWLCPMPLTHVGGLSIPIRSSIYATTAVVHGRFDTERVLEDLMDPARRITLVSLVPTMLSRLLDAGLSRPPSLRWVLLGGGPIPGALLDRAAGAGVPVAPSYGMTETCSQIVTFGWPLPGAEVWTSSGEVVVRGPMVAASALDSDGRLFTGDLGTFDDRGRLVITGRKADTIVTGGENVAPVEVEDVLLTHPAVADAAVFARPDAEWGEAVVASVVLRAAGDRRARGAAGVLRGAARGVQGAQGVRVRLDAAAEQDGEAAAARAGVGARRRVGPRLTHLHEARKRPPVRIALGGNPRPTRVLPKGPARGRRVGANAGWVSAGRDWLRRCCAPDHTT